MTTRILITRADSGGSGFYRASEPARVVNAQYRDVEVRVDPEIDVEASQSYDGWVEVREIREDIDLLVIQRPISQRIHSLAECARRQGIAVALEIDDDFHNVHADNVAAASVDPAKNRLQNKHWLTRCVSIVHGATVSTPALLKYVPPGGIGRVVRNRLPERALGPAPDPPQSVGWTGTTRTHPADLQRARGALAATDLPMRVVGDREGVATALGVPEGRVELAEPWVNDTEAYWDAVRSHIGVGIAPLEPSKFNRAKSYLKPAEYCTFGIPFVASPTPEYRLIAEQSGAGLIAHSAATWSRSVAEVLERRAELSQAGLAWAKENTMEAHAHEWYDAWNAILEAAR